MCGKVNFEMKSVQKMFQCLKDVTKINNLITRFQSNLNMLSILRNHKNQKKKKNKQTKLTHMFCIFFFLNVLKTSFIYL